MAKSQVLPAAHKAPHDLPCPPPFPLSLSSLCSNPTGLLAVPPRCSPAPGPLPGLRPLPETLLLQVLAYSCLLPDAAQTPPCGLMGHHLQSHTKPPTHRSHFVPSPWHLYCAASSWSVSPEAEASCCTPRPSSPVLSAARHTASGSRRMKRQPRAVHLTRPGPTPALPVLPTLLKLLTGAPMSPGAPTVTTPALGSHPDPHH